MIDVGLPGIAAGTAVVVGGADDDVIVAVAVDVASSGHAVAEPVADGLALVRPVRGGRKTGRRAVKDIGLASSRAATAVGIGADDDVVVAVAIDVAGPGNAVAVFVACCLALVRPVRGGRKTGRRAVIHIRLSGAVTTIVVAIGADDDVVVAITVDVASRCYTEAKVVVGCLALV